MKFICWEWNLLFIPLRWYNSLLIQCFTQFYISQKTSCLVKTDAEISLLLLVQTAWLAWNLRVNYFVKIVFLRQFSLLAWVIWPLQNKENNVKITRYIHTHIQTFLNNKKESTKNTFRFQNSGLLSISQRCEASCLKMISQKLPYCRKLPTHVDNAEKIYVKQT